MDRYILVETAPGEQLSILSCVNKRATVWPKTTHSMASHPGDAEEIRAHCPRTISSLTSGLRTSDRFCMNQSPSLPKAPAWGRAKTPTCPKLRPGLSQSSDLPKALAWTRAKAPPCPKIWPKQEPKLIPNKGPRPIATGGVQLATYMIDRRQDSFLEPKLAPFSLQKPKLTLWDRCYFSGATNRLKPSVPPKEKAEYTLVDKNIS